MQHITDELKGKIILCTNCAFYKSDGKMVSCDKDYFNSVPIKKTIIYTPIEFDCWEYEEKNRVLS
jgi:hypothetical protein